jgi:hypothetical protein
MADVITCPSGLTGRVRGMKVREERVYLPKIRLLRHACVRTRVMMGRDMPNGPSSLLSCVTEVGSTSRPVVSTTL